MALRQTKKISELPALSPATLDTTFIVGISGSTTYKISINQLTSSLDTTFATDLVTAALSNSLDTKLSTSSYSTDSASFNSRIISGSAVAGTISGSSQISALGFVTGSYTTINSFNSLTQSFNSISQSFTTVSGSFGSIDFSGINNVTTSYLAFTQSYYSASASFDSRINTVSASVSIGTSGTSGINGTSGTNGTSGAQGNQGPTGPQGNQGPQGESGTSGTTGTSGTNGVQGPQGTQGAQGPQGINGTAGSSGAQGSQGPEGNQGATGSGTQGAQGPTGGTGPQGNQGSNGSNGAQGNQGPQGNQGANGTSGTNGVQGSQGNQGASGSNGSQGNQGPTGPQGTQGAQGNQGATGSGTQGAQGPTGGTGPQGTQGTQGNQGPQGVQGSIGTSGTSGVSIDSGSFATTSSFNTYTSSINSWTSSFSSSLATSITSVSGTFTNLTVNGQPTTYGVVNPAYIVVGLASSISGLGLNQTIILDTVVGNTNSQLSYNSSTGVFTLTAGVTYDMSFTPSFITFSNTTSGFLCYDWVDATSNTPLDSTGTGTGTVIPTTETSGQLDNMTARVIYTPTTNQTVKLRVTNASGTATLRSGIGTQAIVRPLNLSVAVQSTATGTVAATIITDTNPVTNTINGGSSTSPGLTILTLAIPSAGTWRLDSELRVYVPGAGYMAAAFYDNGTLIPGSEYFVAAGGVTQSGAATGQYSGFMSYDLTTTSARTVTVGIWSTTSANAIASEDGRTWARATKIDSTFALNALDTMQISGSLTTTGSITSLGGITGSIRATNGVISGSSQLTSSFDTRYAISASFVSSSNVLSMRTITSASYAALTPVSGTLYIIIG